MIRIRESAPCLNIRGVEKKKVKRVIDTNVMERLAAIAIDIGMGIHKEIGPGLYESVYEAVLEHRLVRAGVAVERQKPIAISVDGLTLPDAFRADLLLEGSLLIELKSSPKNTPLYIRQTLTYCRLINQPFGLIFNFGCETFKDGLYRVINSHAR
jgi:GxxExxY protein